MICTPASRISRLHAVIGTATLALGLLAGGTPSPAAADGLNTSAEYIVTFFRYVQWQDEDRLTAWNVCFAGVMPEDQEQLYVDRTVRNKPFVVRNINADTPIGNCQVIDLTTASNEAASRILSKSRHLPILTVGSGSEFCSRGGQICLRKDNDETRSLQKFEVNLSNIKESKLQISARLLAMGMPRSVGEEAK